MKHALSVLGRWKMRSLFWCIRGGEKKNYADKSKSSPLLTPSFFFSQKSSLPKFQNSFSSPARAIARHSIRLLPEKVRGERRVLKQQRTRKWKEMKRESVCIRAQRPQRFVASPACGWHILSISCPCLGFNLKIKADGRTNQYDLYMFGPQPCSFTSEARAID